MKLLFLLYVGIVIGEGSELLKRLQTINNRFGFQLFKEITAQDRNVLFSPYSLLSALGMVYRGSNGVSYDEITRALHLGLPGQDLVGATLHLAVKEFRKNLKEQDDESRLYIGNRLFTQNGYEIHKTYKKALMYYYGSYVEELDFLKQPTESINRINSWVMGETDFKIRSTVEPPLEKDVSMILINAVYFKGFWEEEFSAADTTKKMFRPDKSSTIEVDMMQNEITVEYCHSVPLRSKAIRLKYKGDGLSMVILLPEEVDGIERLVREMSEKAATEVFVKLNRMTPKQVEVQLPKFKLEESHDLEKMLTAMGMGSLFNKNANLSLINPKGSMKISQVIQKAYVRADEKGSSAAAVTSLIGRTPPFKQPPKYTFHVNHPFLFLITKSTPDQSDLILFMGKVIHPTV